MKSTLASAKYAMPFCQNDSYLGNTFTEPDQTLDLSSSYSHSHLPINGEVDSMGAGAGVRGNGRGSNRRGGRGNRGGGARGGGKGRGGAGRGRGGQGSSSDRFAPSSFQSPSPSRSSKEPKAMMRPKPKAKARPSTGALALRQQTAQQADGFVESQKCRKSLKI